VGVKTVLARWTGRQGRQQESPALLALACDHRKDALTSIGTLVGAGGAALGWLALDPLAAAVTSVFILGMGWETLRGAAGDLMDSALPDGLLRGVTEIAGREPGVEHVHELRGRRSGQYVILDLKLEMDGAMTVKRSHDVAQSVKRRIFEAFPAVGDVMIHVNPHDDPDHEDLIRL
jgi:cation diffusion facilitator family transporter